MFSTASIPRGKVRFWLLLLSASLAWAAVGCGTGGGGGEEAASTDSSGSAGSQRIVATDRIYTLDDFLDAGFKKSKEYDVTSLEGAQAAYYGFFGLDPYNRDEYEVRFYPNHEKAVNVGVAWADEATGPDAVVLHDTQRWQEGLTERRQCAGNGGHHSGKCDNAKYADYMVVGNMILMCQGKETAESLDNCKALLDEMPS